MKPRRRGGKGRGKCQRLSQRDARRFFSCHNRGTLEASDSWLRRLSQRQPCVVGQRANALGAVINVIIVLRLVSGEMIDHCRRSRNFSPLREYMSRDLWVFMMNFTAVAIRESKYWQLDMFFDSFGVTKKSYKRKDATFISFIWQFWSYQKSIVLEIKKDATLIRSWFDNFGVAKNVYRVRKDAVFIRPCFDSFGLTR